ncbi:MAG TPA: phosphatidylinositol-specific phospholipase C/glycerophosphodiester phosphodiesterase family protein [Lacipirellulaceae bacterium]
MAYLYRVVALSVVATIATCGAAFAVEPLPNAHAHNDYWHERPLTDALDRGFTSVEADIFVVDGKLVVGHARDELKPERTLESLYLEPLALRVKENGGRVHQGGERFFLLVDIKSDAQAALAPVNEVLSKYADMLTVVDRGKVKHGAVTIVISGNRPIAELESAKLRYAGIDGRLSDLDSNRPSHLMPMISDNWTSHFKWRGDGEMPAEERGRLKEIVDKVHGARRIVRFWGTPENEAVWRELRSAGVDLIGTDQLDRLATFLRNEGQ